MRWIVLSVLSLVLVQVASAQLNPGDDSKFIEDVNYSDYSTVKPGEKITKKWKIKNTGSVEWKGRYLSRIGDLNEGFKSEKWISIKDTKPGQDCILEVPMTAPTKVGGPYKAEFKMVELRGVDKKGGKVVKVKEEVFLFPNKIAVFILVYVKEW